MKSCFENENNTAGFVDSTGHRTASNLPNNMLWYNDCGKISTSSREPSPNRCSLKRNGLVAVSSTHHTLLFSSQHDITVRVQLRKKDWVFVWGSHQRSTSMSGLVHHNSFQNTMMMEWKTNASRYHAVCVTSDFFTHYTLDQSLAIIRESNRSIFCGSFVVWFGWRNNEQDKVRKGFVENSIFAIVRTCSK